jgi:hypothetical protein
MKNLCKAKKSTFKIESIVCFLTFLFVCRYSEEEIEKMVQERREKLLADLDRKLSGMKEDVLLEAKEREMKKMKSAFGIEDGAEEGRVFKKFESEKQRQLRLERERH